MTFNIWLGGHQVDFGQIAQAIREAQADVIGIQEPRESLPHLAAMLGLHYHTGQNILSRYPILNPPDGSTHYALIEVAPGSVVAVTNVHLRAFPYGPYGLRDGASVPDVLLAEQHHVLEIRARLETLRNLVGQGVPVFLTGDFNVPSHLDWTEQTAGAWNEPFRQPVPWPVSVRLFEYGFRDTYREMHPDPLHQPGFTWTPGYPVGRMDEGEVHDRIDFVYAAGPSQTVQSLIVGEAGPYTDIVVTPWASDHRAVVSRFRVEPVSLDTLK